MLYEELCRRVRDSETTLAECASKKFTSEADWLDQQEKLKVGVACKLCNSKVIFLLIKSKHFFLLLVAQTLVKDVETLSGKLEELREWCPVQGCRSNRDDAVYSLWGQVARLRQCAGDLLAHSEWRGEEWTRITMSVSYITSQPDVMRSFCRFVTGEF